MGDTVQLGWWWIIRANLGTAYWVVGMTGIGGAILVITVRGWLADRRSADPAVKLSRLGLRLRLTALAVPVVPMAVVVVLVGVQVIGRMIYAARFRLDPAAVAGLRIESQQYHDKDYSRGFTSEPRVTVVGETATARQAAAAVGQTAHDDYHRGGWPAWWVHRVRFLAADGTELPATVTVYVPGKPDPRPTPLAVLTWNGARLHHDQCDNPAFGELIHRLVFPDGPPPPTAR